MDDPATLVARDRRLRGWSPEAFDPRVQVGGVFPHMTVMAPGVGSDSETGIGALRLRALRAGTLAAEIVYS